MGSAGQPRPSEHLRRPEVNETTQGERVAHPTLFAPVAFVVLTRC
jgi:hypothetical protein